MEPYADNFIPVIPIVGDIFHSEQNPFCIDPTCPCHEDPVRILELATHVQEGHITPEEATNIVSGKTI